MVFSVVKQFLLTTGNDPLPGISAVANVGEPYSIGKF